MTSMSVATDESAQHDTRRRDQQVRDLRFLEMLQETLARCGDEQSICGSPVHRLVAADYAVAACLASFDPVSRTFDLVHAAGIRHDWSEDLCLRAVEERRTLFEASVAIVPVIYGGDLFGERTGWNPGEGPVWGILGVVLPEGDQGWRTGGPKYLLRRIAERVAVELERRKVRLLDDVLDGLLRKTKPIDVYTHTLREVRRFVRYDHGASVMTIQRGMAQVTVRSENVVGLRGNRETLRDSPRRGRVIWLTPLQLQFINDVKGTFVVVRRGDSFDLMGDGGGEVDAESLWRVLGLEDGSPAGAVMCHPLIFGGQTLGILRLAARRPDAFGSVGQYARLLDRFARLLAVTLYRSELYHQSDHQLQAIKEMGRAITEPKSVEDVCHQVMQLALRVLHVQVGAVGLLGEDHRVQLVAHQGCTLADPPVLEWGQGIAGGVIATGHSRAVADVDTEPSYVVFNARVRSELVAPITYDREVLGFLAVESYEKGRFREEDEEVITFLEALANQAAIAIKTSQLHFDAVRRLSPSVVIDPALSTAGLQDLLLQELRDKIQQLGAANERLASANRAKSEFLARMSHDLRGPLNVMVGLANLLTDPSVQPTLDGEKQRESLEIIRSSGEVLSSLIGNILDLSALEAGKVEFNLSSLDAQTAFSYLRAMATTLAGESLRDLRIEVMADPGISSIQVDEEKFLRIMINLISNAVKFTPSGGRVDVTTFVDGGLSATGDLHVIVSDTGIGIPEEHLENVFQPFMRIHGSPSGQHHGTGLGLAVVRQLVELHGGAVWVESKVGSGSRFHVRLPHAVVDPQQGETTVASVARHAPPAPVTSSACHSRGLVLVVEDTEAHLDMMRLAVTSRGYTMHGAGSGEEAITWLVDHRPKVILLDMQLPGIDGFEVAAHVKGSAETHDIPIIAVTADALSANEERARASGCDAYLTKPIDMAALMAAIDAVAE